MFFVLYIFIAAQSALSVGAVVVEKYHCPAPVLNSYSSSSIHFNQIQDTINISIVKIPLSSQCPATLF